MGLAALACKSCEATRNEIANTKSVKEAARPNIPVVSMRGLGLLAKHETDVHFVVLRIPRRVAEAMSRKHLEVADRDVR